MMMMMMMMMMIMMMMLFSHLACLTPASRKRHYIYNKLQSNHIFIKQIFL